MTRKQAMKIADQLVRLTRAAIPPSERETWITQRIKVTPAVCDAIDNFGGLIVGCLPLGWRIVGAKGTTTVTIRRET
jgi:hypothetical protein